MSRPTGHRGWLISAALAISVGFRATALAADGPPASAGHALVFHDGLKAVLLVNAGLGGMTSPPPTTRTTIWKWTGTSWVVVDAQGPPIRNLGGVAYDSQRDVLVLYGGTYDENTTYDDTWEWNPRGGWQRKGVSGPGKRDHTAMAYDAVRRHVVLFGGQIGADSFPADTWTWDGASWRRWLQPAGPSRRVHHTMTYDPISRRVLLFGGYDPPSTGRGDTWAWSGSAWTKAAAGSYPRTHACLAATAHGVVLIGGFPARASPSIPLLVSESWKSEDQPNNPGARYLTAAAYDPIRKVTVLFGGCGPPDDIPRADTWEYAATAGWREIR